MAIKFGYDHKTMVLSWFTYGGSEASSGPNHHFDVSFLIEIESVDSRTSDNLEILYLWKQKASIPSDTAPMVHEADRVMGRRHRGQVCMCRSECSLSRVPSLESQRVQQCLVSSTFTSTVQTFEEGSKTKVFQLIGESASGNRLLGTTSSVARSKERTRNSVGCQMGHWCSSRMNFS